MEENEIKIKISQSSVDEAVKEFMFKEVSTALNLSKNEISKQMKEYFEKSFFNNRESHFESGLDWAIENCFRAGINKAMEELKFDDMILKEAKKMLQDGSLIKELAEKKVLASLGLKKV